MIITVAAVYENGVLRLKEPLPLQDQQQVTVTVHSVPSLARQSVGMIPWAGDRETLEQLATDPEFGILEAP